MEDAASVPMQIQEETQSHILIQIELEQRGHAVHTTVQCYINIQRDVFTLKLSSHFNRLIWNTCFKSHA